MAVSAYSAFEAAALCKGAASDKIFVSQPERSASFLIFPSIDLNPLAWDSSGHYM